MIRFTNISKRMMQCSFMLMLFLVQSVAASAETKLYMENFSIANGEIMEVALLLNNDKAATALQAKIDLPNGLQYVDGSIAKTDRVKGRAAEVQASTTTGQLVIVETDGTIAAGEGAVITFMVERAGGVDDDYNITISDIIVSDANAEQLNTEETQTVKVSFVGLKDCTFAGPEAIDVAVGQEYQVDITLKNDGVHNLSALQGKLALPAGLEIVPGEDGKFIYSDRIPAKAEFKFQEFDGYTQFVLSSSSNQTITDVEGVIFSFKVKATEALAENAEIKLTDLFVAATTGASVQSPDVTISVTNTSVADKAAFEAYQTEQAAAVVAMAVEGDSEASQALIADAKAAIEGMAYDYAKTLDEQKAAIDEVVTTVAAALETQREADAFKAYQEEKAAAVVAMAVEGDSEASQKIIADAKAAIEGMAFDSEKTLDEQKAAIDEVVTTVAAALEAQREAEATEAAAVEAANAKLADLKTAAEALAVSEEAKASEDEAVKAAVADAETAIAAVAPAISAVEAIIAEGKLATDNKEALETAFAAVEGAIKTADDAIKTAENALKEQQEKEAAEAAAVEAANAKLADLKTAAEALAVSEEAKAYEAENVKAAVADAETAIAAVAPTITAVEAIIAEGKLATDNKEALETAFAAVEGAIKTADDAIKTAENTYKNQKQIDDAAEAGAKASAEASLLSLQIAMEDAVVSDEAKAYEAENVQAAVADAETAIATANDAIAAVEAIIAEGKLATDNKVAIAQAINAAQKAVNAAQTAAAVAEKTYIDQKEEDEKVIPGDVNGDGEVNVGDLVCVSNFMAGDAGDITKEAADVNKDGEVNVGDMVVISNIMSGNE